MLNLAETLLARGRHYQDLGRSQDALRIFNQLSGFRMLPPEVAEETQFRLAELYLLRGKFRKARRLLTAALTNEPGNAMAHSLMALSFAEDPRGDKQLAAEHYRRSLRLDPSQPDILAEFGLFALRLGQTDEGLRCLRQASELAPDDPDIVQMVVEGLQEADRAEEARLFLQAALFRNSRDTRFRKLWDDFRFHHLRLEQERSRRQARAVQEVDEPALLPFIPRSPDRPAPQRVKRKIIRHDGPSQPSGPHSPRVSELPDRHHAG
jgi:tetratricopeptide (TPR) repeat protein